MAVQVGTEPRHICGECNHAEQNHDTTQTKAGAPRCCFGWCPCVLDKAMVRADYPAQQRPVFGGFDHASGRWSA